MTVVTSGSLIRGWEGRLREEDLMHLERTTMRLLS